MKTIDRKEFFDAVRRELYGGTLSQAQVDVMDPALTAWERAFLDKGEDASVILTRSWLELPLVEVPPPPGGRMKISDEGVRMLEEREGLRTTAYLDSVGVWTIGIGHTSAAGPPTVTEGLTITKDEAYEIFRRDVVQYEEAVLKAVKVEMRQHEFDAYTSLCYNIGPGAFSGSTTVKRLNAADSVGAADAILMWNKPPEIMPRRQGEWTQFGQGNYFARADSKGNLV